MRQNKKTDAPKKPVNIGRHENVCTICKHADRAAIEQCFISWESPTAIAKEYGLSDRATVYRHAHAFGLFAKRQRNIRAALEKIIEQAGEVEVTSAAVVAAVQAYAKINAQGQWIDRSEHVNLNELFERMSESELRTYAETGRLPAWFEDTVGKRVPATAGNSSEGDDAL
jgi:hypothetical protein